MITFLYFLVLISHSSLFEITAYSVTSDSDVTEYCEMECKDVCIVCTDPVTCTANQTDCGLGSPDPSFGGVCPPHSVCVDKGFNCK